MKSGKKGEGTIGDLIASGWCIQKLNKTGHGAKKTF
jgi:hypothetical protein